MDAGRKRRTQYRILVYLLAYKAWKRMAALGYRVFLKPRSTTLEVGPLCPKLIVYHLDKTLTDQLAEIGLKPGDIARVAISHTHGDHIGNVGLFPNSTILMQQAEYSWIHSRNGPNDNVNQLMALARKLLGTPKNLQLIDGDTDVFGDGSVTLVSTPGHTPAASRC